MRAPQAVRRRWSRIAAVLLLLAHPWVGLIVALGVAQLTRANTPVFGLIAGAGGGIVLGSIDAQRRRRGLPRGTASAVAFVTWLAVTAALALLAP